MAKRLASVLLLAGIASLALGAEREKPAAIPSSAKGPFVLILNGFKGNPEQGCSYARQLYVWIGPAQEFAPNGELGHALTEQPAFESLSLNGQIFTVPDTAEGRPYWEAGGVLWLQSDIAKVLEDGR